jgi:SAM-dependent methyltransferase
VLYAGHLYVWKGVDVLAKAAALLPDNARVIFVGGIDHDIRAFRERFANGENEIAAKIVVAGRRPHELIPYYLKAADVLVLPNSARRDISRLYTSPLKLFEYMASGTPIVASDLPSIREILNENNSVLCAPDNPVVLAATISKILNDGGLSAKISVQALSDVIEHTWDKRAAAIVDFIRPILVAKDATKDRDFYNKESAGYSSKRYPERASDYIQFFFKKRLSLTLKVLSRAFNDKTSLSLLEIGCADGVVMREISKKVPRVFSEMTGIDTAEEMIKKAKAMDSQFLKTRYFVRGQEPAGARFDAIIEIGVANYTDFDAELRYAADHLKSGGKYILSIAGNGSLNARLGGGVGYANFLSYGEYEDKIRGLFSLEMSLPVGLRVPLIWRTPALARFVQPILENTFLHIAPGLFHEKVYLLKKL